MNVILRPLIEKENYFQATHCRFTEIKEWISGLITDKVKKFSGFILKRYKIVRLHTVKT